MSELAPGLQIAVIGMAGRFPGAGSVDELWTQLIAGRHGISQLEHTELERAGVPAEVWRDPAYVAASGALDDVEDFDAELFGISPAEAAALDPQHRLLLECGLEALAHAGLKADAGGPAIGIYAGVGEDCYAERVRRHAERNGSLAPLQLRIATKPDFAATRIAYLLDLRGPAVSIQTACSTSLVAVHLACQALLNGDTDIALAGGATVVLPHPAGYLYRPGDVLSQDGACRAFDAAASGTVPGSGAGLVVLRRLDEALTEGDYIHAVVKGTAINNDGAAKAGFTAPSVDGQISVIEDALAAAGTEPHSIGYVEAHGTGTPLGDPLEVRALREALADDAHPGCLLGSIKTNLGHLDAAAGIAGLIKAILSVREGRVPPSLHFERPNPQLDLGPLAVVTEPSDWPLSGPRRASVSSFGIGGTNAHAIVEQPPPPAARASDRTTHLLPLSARTQTALETLRTRLAHRLQAQPQPLADVANTLATGRRQHHHRYTAVVGNLDEAIDSLAGGDVGHAAADNPPAVVFAFPGQGAQVPGMAAALYRSEPLFRELLDHCLLQLEPLIDADLRPLLVENHAAPEVANRLTDTGLAQPGLFAVEYALAGLLLDWGVKPAAVVGHSLGEYVAACVAGVLDLDDALRVVAARARAVAAIPGGSMLAVGLAEEELRPRLSEELSVASVNGPDLCVISGEDEAVERLRHMLEAEQIGNKRLRTSHAFHSPQIAPAVPALVEALASVELRAPRVPLASNLTGTWMSADQATDPAAWGRHLLETVRFGDCLETIDGALVDPLLLEVGPGSGICAMASAGPAQRTRALPTLPRADARPLWEAIGTLWSEGVEVDWKRVYAREPQQRVPLPGHPFERQRHWIEAPPTLAPRPPSTSQVALEGETQSQAHKPPAAQPALLEADTWVREDRGQSAQALPPRWLMLVCEDLGEAVASELARRGAEVAVARLGESFRRVRHGRYELRPDVSEDFETLARVLAEDGFAPVQALHAWACAVPGKDGRAPARARHHGLMLLARTLAATGGPRRLVALTSAGHDVLGSEPIEPWSALALGSIRALAHEHPHWSLRQLDVDLASGDPAELACAVVNELGCASPIVALRGSRRWVPTTTPVDPTHDAPALRNGGAYLITGGLGGMGLTFAEYLVEAADAQLALVTRSPASAHPGASETIQRLERRGAAPLVLQADVSDRDALIAAVTSAQERYGPLRGVIHAAGVPERALAAANWSVELAERVLAPKVQGTLLLDELLRAQGGIDFMVLCSSLDVRVGEPGAADYCAANAFMDSFARRAWREHRTHVVSIAWPPWREVGMAASAAPPTGLKREWDRALAAGVTPDEGVRLLWLALGAKLPHVTIPAGSARTNRAAAPVVANIMQATPGIRPPGAATHSAATPVPASGASPGSGDLVAVVSRIWAQLLGVDRLEPDDDLLTLGAHSLMATQVATRLRDELGRDLPVAAVIAARTARDLAAELEPVIAPQGPATRSSAAAGTATSGTSSASAPTPGVRELPATAAQRRMWFLQELEPNFPEYVIAFAVRLFGTLDRDALTASISDIVARHEPLRTTFRDADGLLQVIHPPEPVPVPLHDLAHGERCDEDAQALAAKLAYRPFDLRQGPPLRADLIRVENTDHVLIVSVHHIVFDGWSLGIFRDELAELYAARRDARPPKLEPLSKTFAQLFENATEEYSDADLAWWRERLAGVRPLELPADRVRPRVRSPAGATLPVEIPAEVAGPLLSLARERGATPFMALLTIFAAALGRWAETDDVVIGTPLARRDSHAAEQAIGLLLNMLVLRVDMSGRPSAGEFIERVRDVVIEAQRHGSVPLDRLVDELAVERDRSRTPLFQVELVLDPQPAELALPGLETEDFAIPWSAAQFDLTLRLHPDGAGLSGQLEYATALFDEGTMRSFADSLRALAAALVAAPNEPLATLPATSPEQADWLVGDWNPAPTPYPNDLTLHGLVEAQVQRTPTAEAVTGDDVTLTYAELDAHAARLAELFAERGAQRGTVVALCLNRSPLLVVAVLATLKAGAAYLPLEPDDPPARLEALARRAEAVLAVADDEQSAAALDSINVLLLDQELLSTPAGEPRPGAVLSPDELVSVYYTSGSTGAPKAVANTHRGWVNRMAWMQRRHTLRPGQSVLFKTTITFDDSAVELFWPLTTGGRIVVLPAGLQRDPRAILNAADHYAVAVLQFVPSMLAAVLAELAQHERRFPSLRHVISSGESLDPALVGSFHRSLARDGAKLHNQWGVTEVSIDSTIHSCSAADASRPVVPIGRALDNNAIYLLDGDLQPVPPGMPGDIYIAGVGLARCYLGDPRATATAFVPNPFVSGERMYRSGDRGRLLPDGSLIFLGRQDAQVKLRGMRVELGEIEHALTAQPGVHQAAVRLWEPGPSDRRLAAYAVLEPGTTPQDVLQAVAEVLPAHMVPASLVPLERLPSTTSGKVDRRALPDPDPGQLPRPQRTPPTTEAEIAVADAYAELLGVADVALDDDFFALGGHSLLATRLIGRLRSRLRLDLPLGVIFDAPSVRGLAAAVDRAAVAAQGEPTNAGEEQIDLQPETVP